MKSAIRFFIIIALFMYSTIVSGQTTYSPTVRSSNNNCIIDSIVIADSETIVYVKCPRVKLWGAFVRFSSNTALIPSDAIPISLARKCNLDFLLTDDEREFKQALSDNGYLIRSLGPCQLDTEYSINKRGIDWYHFELHFDKLPAGIEDIYLREFIIDGFEWDGIKVNNPYTKDPDTPYSECSIKQIIDEQNDGIVGIYEGTKNNYKLGCINENGIYKLIYLGNSKITQLWRVGDVKATLRPTAVRGLFKADWYSKNKSLSNEYYIEFDDTNMKVSYDGDEELYLKMYPVAYNGSSIGTPKASSLWSGSGFALKDGYIVTNHHVVDGAKFITVKGIKGDFSTYYSAEVAAIDKNNDLALIRINDSLFSGFGNIPYSVKTSTSDVGEDVYVLGYPLTTTMGDEIKYTTGVISSKTGFQGDVSVYQISAPIQPGNSGGPLFDSKGNLIGIVNAKHTGAENVGYAIKASCLRNFIESFTTAAIIPSANSTSSLSRTEQIKSIKEFVFLIECSSSLK